MVQSLNSRDRLATIPSLPTAAPQTATTYGPASGGGTGTTTYNLDQFRQTPGSPALSSAPVQAPRASVWDRLRGRFADVARSQDNTQIHEEFMARARQQNYLMPGHGDRRRVITLQQRLNSVGISVEVTGNFDYSTSRAVRELKQRAGIHENFVTRDGQWSITDVMTPEAEQALTQLSSQAGYRPTGPATDRDVIPGSRGQHTGFPGAAQPGAAPAAPGAAPAGSAAPVTEAEMQRFRHLQQIARPREQGGVGYPLQPADRAFYEDVRGRLLAQQAAGRAPSAAPGQVGQPAVAGPMALLNSPNIPATGPVSASEAAAADAFEQTLGQNPTALDTMPGIMYRNFLTIRARQAASGDAPAPGAVPQAPAAQLPSRYTVQQGDTFESIAQAIGVDANALFSANADRLGEWQRAHPDITRRFNEYYRTQQSPNPYLLPRGFELTVPGAERQLPPVDMPAPARPSGGSRPSSSGSPAPSGGIPASTFTTDVVDDAQYDWFIARMDAGRANQLPAQEQEAFNRIANKTQVTPELDARLRGSAPAGPSAPAPSAPAPSYSGPSLTIDVNDPDPDLQAALRILARVEAGQQVSAEERAQYRTLMANYRARTFLGN